ncbi:MAG: DUF3291 domain-containing protein [Pseudomonadales bacterium]|nr:DUF3291 domain-containing protein [Pseudomonadales bacterium]
MSDWHLAQVNIARALAPVDSPLLQDFVDNLERLNALADNAPGFVWRLQSDSGDATDFRPYDDDTLINMSVWEDLESLHHYVYRSAHVEIMKRRKEWFERMADAYTVLWWVPAGHIPSIEEAVEKLALLQAKGPGPEAFTFAKPFPQPQNDEADPLPGFDDGCPAY